MKSAKKILSYIIAAAMTVSLMPAVSFAAPEEEPARPSIANPLEAGEDYIGGYDAINAENA